MDTLDLMKMISDAHALSALKQFLRETFPRTKT